MHKRTLKVALLVTLAIIMVLGITTVALAASWKDLPDTVTGKYQITDDQVAQISDGFANGLWKPYINVTREQFVKMADAAFKIPLANPATATYTDVPKGSLYYQYIEGATAAGMTNGFGGATFKPNDPITREQAIAIVVRWVAKANGYTLATQYTAAQITALLAPFSDAAAVNLKPEIAFAIDFGITEGNAYGKLAPASNMTRIQGAAFLIRATAMIPPVPVKASKVEIVSGDKGENLIGQSHAITFKATKSDGTPAVGVLVDFDTLAGEYFVGNISPQSAMTNNFGEATVNLISNEPGIEGVSASVPGLAAVVATKYWLVLDEVYTTATNTGYDDTTTDGTAIPVQNNAGTTHDWSVQVTVFGPGPRSTSPQDWYNAISTATFDPSNLKPDDGIDASQQFKMYEWNQDFVANAKNHNSLAYNDFAPRTMAGITINWSILPTYDADAYPGDGGLVDIDYAKVDKDEVPSVGTITKVDGAATGVAANGKSAAGTTNANGVSTITITSQVTGFTPTQAVANYAGNPFPGTLFSHETFSSDSHHLDWEPQPDEYQFQLKQWIPHTLPVTSGPLSLASVKDNTGEDELVTLALVDVFGNAIPGYQVEWTLQGVGVLKNAQTVTDATGKATATLYSSEPGQSIVETKVLDKSGLPAYVYAVTKQWYQIDSVAFTPLSVWALDSKGKPIVGTPVSNLVGTDHTFTVQVSGLKWVWTSTDINENGLNDDVAMVISRDSAYAAAGTIVNEDGTLGAAKPINTDLPVQTVMMMHASPDDSNSPYIYVTRFADATLLAGEYWGYAPGGDNDSDDPMVIWSGLAGKGVDFFNNIGDADTPGTGPSSNMPIPVEIGGGTNGMPEFVGTIKSFTAPWTDVMYGGSKYHYDAVTDANGQATVTVTSTVKGDQYIYAVADYPGNPQSSGALNAATPLQWSQLLFATAEKVWLANATGATSIKVFGLHPTGDLVGTQDDESTAPIVDGNSYTNPVFDFLYETNGSASVFIGPALPVGTRATAVATVAAGAVTGFTGLPSGTGYTQADVGKTVIIGAPTAPGSGASANATIGTVGLVDNAVVQIHVTAGGSGYAVAPTVNISAPDIAGGTQATATANIAGGNVVSVTIVVNGSGYINAPTVTFSTGTQATATIQTVVAGQVTALNLTSGGSGYPTVPTVTIPLPVKTQATATATVVAGVVTAITMNNVGAGYINVPPVNIGGNGTGASAHAVVNADSTVTVVLDSGGTGYTGGDTSSAIGDNPNRETLAVQVFDQYGNALPDYKVKWQIVQQGTTSSGTVPTYHPYAHFEYAAHSMSEEPNESTIDHESYLNDVAGIGDTNSHVDTNPIWNNGTSDDDLAWGYTLDGQINFTEDLDSAAHVDLVMDDSRATLDAMALGTEFSDIVNVTVYAPDGSQYAQFTQIKNWTLTPPVLTKIALALSETDMGPWVTSLTTNVHPLWNMVVTSDQYGNASPANIKIKVAGPVATTLNIGPVDGIAVNTFTAPLTKGTYTFTAWNDANSNGFVDVGELQSAPATLIVP